MATDRLINQTQGEDIIDQLQDIATKVGAITYGPQTTSDKVVAMTGYAKASTEAVISEGDTLNEAVGKLEKKADDALAGLDTKVVGPESSTTGAIATYSDATGNALANSGVTIATSTQGVTDSDTAVPTSKAVQAYTANTEHTYAFDTGTDNGTIKVTPSVGGVEGTAQSVAVKGLAGAAYKGVDTAPTASSANLVESGGVYTALGNKLDATANAASAAKLNNGTSDYEVGTATKGVYFDDGIPKAMTYSVESNVPENAVFTDTTYTKATNSAISVDNTNHTIDVATASTTTKGVVQLTNTLPASTATEDNKVPTALTVSQAIASLPEPMVFKGSVTGTYPSNPSVGDTYKATANSNSGVTPAYKSGDTVIYATGGWTVIPSGDEPSGTVTAVSVNGTQYDPGTGGVVSLPNYPDISGKIDTAGTGLAKDGTTLNHSNSITAKTTASALKVKYDAQGHITGSSALTASDISAVPTSRTVNSKALSSNITLAGSDIALTGYSKGSSTAAVVATDTTNSAIAKHENRIDTNRANILYALNTGVRNICTNAEYSDGTKTAQNTTFTTLSDGTVTVKTPSGQTSTTDTNNFYNVWFANTSTVLIPVGTWMCKLYGTDISNIRIEYSYILNGTTTTTKGNFGEAFEMTIPTGVTASWLRICAKPSTSFNSSFKIVVCDKTVWNTYTPTEYVPPAKPNYDLTRLESEDRAGLVECVDGGAKNKIPNIASSTTVGEAVFTVNSDGSVSVYTTAATTAARSLIILDSSKGITVNASDIVSGVPASASASSVSIEWGIGTSGNIDRVWGDNPDGYKAIGYSGSIRYVAIKIESGKTIPSSSPLKFYPMICTKAAFGVSTKFVPYTKSNSQLTTELGSVKTVLEAIL